MAISESQNTETAIFAAGCFWGIEYKFSKVSGIICAESGYIGGDIERPTYQQVCTGTTGHAEAVRVVYETEKLSYADVLEVFWQLHDPTQKDRQGPDIGRQYRSAIFCVDEAQFKTAQESLKQQQQNHSGAIVTEINLAGQFWRAEDYHQKYLEKRGQ